MKTQMAQMTQMPFALCKTLLPLKLHLRHLIHQHLHLRYIIPKICIQSALRYPHRLHSRATLAFHVIYISKFDCL